MLFTACVPLSEQGTDGYEHPDYVNQKTLELIDKVYEDNVRTVRLYPFTGAAQDLLRPAVVHISQNNPFVLQFDILDAQFEKLNARIIHCNADWSQSALNDVEYLNDFNAFPITEYQNSFNTKVNYVHYEFLMPQVKVTGNYVIVVYRGYNEKDILLSKRFAVYDTKVAIKPEVGFSTDIAARGTNQQVNFTIHYDNFFINNPMEELKVKLRQNQRWDNMITDLPPMFVREDLKEVQYRHINRENNFYGGNEFRRFDLQSVRTGGFGVADADYQTMPPSALLTIDKSRNHGQYLRYDDLNGKYYINNIEYGNPSVEGDYANVTFRLDHRKLSGKIYIIGELTNWQLLDEFEMKYNGEKEMYMGTPLLKQGYYNYQYVYIPNATTEADYTMLEGTFNNTENEYEIFAYFRPIGARADQLIGYYNVVYEGY